VRRVQAASLAVVVLLATTGGVLILSQAFRSDGRPATPSPAGRLNGDIVFARIVKGEQHLWVSDTSGAERQFTTSFEDPSTSETYPDVSPDGRRVVFTASTPDGRVSLYTVDMAGGTVQAILDPSMIGTQPDWSPDGGSIAFAGYDGSDAGVFIVRSDGSDLRFVSPPSLFSAGDPSWTPDGSRIVFSASVGEGTDVGGEPFQMDLYSMRVDGTGLRRLTDTPGVQEQQADVSPDGRTIVFTSQIGAGDRTRAGLSTLSIDGGSPQLFLKPDGIHGSPSWSPDGELIVFEWYESGSSIYIIGRDGTGLTRLGSGSAPSWQPLSVPSGTSPQPQPTVSETPEPGRDIGLSFLVCHMSAIKGIDFLGDGAEGTAWVGTQLEAGRCVSEYEGDNIVAVDVTGDGLADSWAGPLAHCVSCSPFDITDLNGDGILGSS
jgi:Periplasmic component of the Tol biopolymer transport system